MASDPLLVWIARGALALLFGAAALHKLRDLDSFAGALRGHALLPESWVDPGARLLCAAECALAAALLAEPTARAAALAGAALLALYSAAIATNLARGRRDIDCGCSLRPQPLSARLLARNALLAAGALLAAQTPSARALGWLDLAAGSACITALALTWLAAGTLAAQASRRPAGAV